MFRHWKNVFHRRRNSLPSVEKLEAMGYETQIAQIIHRAQTHTMTSPARLAALCDAVAYIAARKIPGDLVECGVWQGGSMMAAAMALIQNGDIERQIYLYDTYEGMTPPSQHDQSWDGVHAARLLEESDRDDPRSVWCVSPLELVQRNLQTTQYPAAQLHFVKGKVEETIPHVAPSQIALLRLDTDWYESTRHELVHLFPRLSRGGVLIIDDYGHWKGARRAVDEYFEQTGNRLLLSRIDYTGRMAVA